MQRLETHINFLSSLTDLNLSQAKKFIQTATDEQIKILIEIIISYKSIADEQNLNTFSKDIKLLQKIKWNLKTARDKLVSHLHRLIPIVASTVLFLIETEVCAVF